MRLTHCYVTSVEMDKDGVFLTTALLPLAIKYTVVVKWRSPADGVAGLGGLTVASNPGFPFRIVSRSFGEKSEGKPGRISHVIRWHRDVDLPDAKATTSLENTQSSWKARARV